MQRPNLYIFSTGTELSTGRSLDSNGPYIARMLVENGFDVDGMSIIPDDPVRLKSELRHVLDRPEIAGAIMTGGLGPTDDDHTVDVYATLTNTPVVEDTEALRKIELLAQRWRGRFKLESIRRQVRVLEGCEVLRNEHGLAPGMLVEYPRADQKPALLAAMPGVPQEMTAMFEKQLLPRLREKLGTRDKERSNFYIYGIGESTFQADFFGVATGGRARGARGANESPARDSDKLPIDKSELSSDFSWGITAGRGLIKIFFESYDKAEIHRLDTIAREVYGSMLTDAPAPDLLHEYCLEHQLQIGAAESCTGGFISKLLTDRAGSSGYFRGGIVTYSNEAKMRLLGVEPKTLEEFGAVSEETVREMATGALNALECDFTCAVSGVAGPGGGSKEKPVGTVWLACAGRDREVFTHKLFLPLDRDRVREYSANLVLFHLYRYVVEAAG